TCSRAICSSKSECITIAAAPASSRRRTLSRSSTRGEAPGIKGCGSFSPRYVVVRSIVPSLGRGRRGLFDRGHLDARELLVDRVAPGRALLGHAEEAAEAQRVELLHHPEARLVPHVLAGRDLGGRRVENERRKALGHAPRVEAVERPYRRLHRELLLV